MAAIDAFSAQLGRLADLTDDELTTLESELMGAFDAADQTGEQVDMEQLAEALDTVRAELDRRNIASEPGAEEEAALEAAAESATETVTPETKKEPVVMASATNIPADRAPKVVEDVNRNAIVAAADIPGYAAGTKFQNLDDYSKAAARRINTLTQLSGGDGEKVIIASVVAEAPEDQVLRINDPEGNRAKIEAATSLQSITAAGGCCAPLTTRYDMFSIGVTSRPVRDSRPGFQADRGGIRFFQSPSLSSINTSSGIWTCDDDAAYDESDDATRKICTRIDCPSDHEALTHAVTSCITFGNMHTRVFPENVKVNTDLSLVQHARVAESNLLRAIKAGSRAVTGQAVSYGAVRDILLTIARAGAWYRDRNRLDEDVPLRAMIPVFVLDVLRSDIIVQPPAGDGRTADFGISRRDVENFFDQWGINVTWTLDSHNPTANGGGFYGDLSGSTLPELPSTVEWALYAEGAWLYLDGGTLDLGVVRDAKLVRSNDYMQFSETFEGVAKVGGESLWVSSPLSIRGGYSPAITIPAVPAG